MLAKLQMGEFLAEVTQRFDRIEVLEEPSWVPNLIFRSVNGLRIRFHPSQRPANGGSGRSRS
jgi:cytochrome P450